MEEPKKLELEVIVIDGGAVVFKVKSQEFRRKGFFQKTDTFRASNGITLYSFGFPEWRPTSRVLYVRGGDVDDDDRYCQCSIVVWKDIESAVKEYNESFQSSDVKRDNKKVEMKELEDSSSEAQKLLVSRVAKLEEALLILHGEIAGLDEKLDFFMEVSRRSREG